MVLARGIAAVIMLVALGAAGQALGRSLAPVPFSASFDGGGTISFQLDKKPKNDRKVRDIQVVDISANCDGRNAELDFKIFGNTNVLDDRSFAVRSEDADGAKAIVRGRFSRKFKRAKGSARLYGKFDVDSNGDRVKCESNKQKFVAMTNG